MSTQRSSSNGKQTSACKALELAIGQIEKDFGRGSIMRLGEASARMAVETIPTGSLALDIALGAGGVPRGRITEIYGPEMAGKSTVAMHIIAQAQKLGGLAAYIDVEHAMDPTFADAIGINIEDLLISQPDTGEQAMEICEALVRSNAVDVIVVDSVAALVPRAEIEGDMGDSLPGLQARLMSQALRKLTAAVSRSRTAAHLHQPAAREDRHRLRQPGDHARRPRAQVLQLRPHRAAPRRDPQAVRHRHRQPRAGQDREEQDRAALPPGRVRHHLLTAPNSASAARATSSTSRVGRGDRQEAGRLLLVTRTTSSARAASRRRSYLREHPELVARDRGLIRAKAPRRSRRRLADRGLAPGADDRGRSSRPGQQRPRCAITAIEQQPRRRLRRPHRPGRPLRRWR